MIALVAVEDIGGLLMSITGTEEQMAAGATPPANAFRNDTTQ